MTVLLVSDRFDCRIEYLLNGLYLDEDRIPFAFKEVMSIDEAIQELKGNDYKLVITGEFPLEPEPGMDLDQLAAGPEVFRLLQFCEENHPRVNVCIVSILITMSEVQEEMYRAYPCVAEVLGKPFSRRKEKKLKKLIERIVLEPSVNPD